MNFLRENVDDSPMLQFGKKWILLSQVSLFVCFCLIKLTLSRLNQNLSFRLRHLLQPISRQLNASKIRVEYILDNENFSSILDFRSLLNNDLLQILLPYKLPKFYVLQLYNLSFFSSGRNPFKMSFFTKHGARRSRNISTSSGN